MKLSEYRMRSFMLPNRFVKIWGRTWMRFADLGLAGRLATRIATWFQPPYVGRYYLAKANKSGYISPHATIHHSNLRLGSQVFIDDRVLIYQVGNEGSVDIAQGVHILRDTIIQTGAGGKVTIGANSYIQPRCQFSAYCSAIEVGQDVQIAPNCGFYPYNHGTARGQLMKRQPLTTKGPIIIGDDAWLGFGVVVLDGVKIGQGAIVGAGSVVTSNVPDEAIVVGVPARIIGMREAAVAGEEGLTRRQ